ncbi:MAG: hypothetical protein WC732_08440 [Candidatus Omnitrophota bacterium]
MIRALRSLPTDGARLDALRAAPDACKYLSPSEIRQLFAPTYWPEAMALVRSPTTAPRTVSPLRTATPLKRADEDEHPIEDS